MAPRTRSGRVEKLHRDALIARGVAINATGLPALPPDVIIEIISALPRQISFCHPANYIYDQKAEYLDRRATIHALSQTCRSLRRVSLPYLWQSIEVYDGLKLRNGERLPYTYQRMRAGVHGLNYARELISQLETVTVRQPSLAAYVRYIDVLLLFGRNLKAVYQELLRCISLFPNLTTVRLTGSDLGGVTDELQVGQNYQFPQIRNLYLDRSTIYFASACPKIRRLDYPTEYKFGGMYVNWPLRRIDPSVFRNVSIIGTLHFYPELFDDLKVFVNLREITLDPLFLRFLVAHNKDLATQHTRLQVIRIRADQVEGYILSEDAYPTEEEEEDWIQWSEDVLRRIQDNDDETKEIDLTSLDGNRTLLELLP